jgi:hypothetical protein
MKKMDKMSVEDIRELMTVCCKTFFGYGACSYSVEKAGYNKVPEIMIKKAVTQAIRKAHLLYAKPYVRGDENPEREADETILVDAEIVGDKVELPTPALPTPPSKVVASEVVGKVEPKKETAPKKEVAPPDKYDECGQAESFGTVAVQPAPPQQAPSPKNDGLIPKKTEKVEEPLSHKSAFELRTEVEKNATELGWSKAKLTGWLMKTVGIRTRMDETKDKLIDALGKIVALNAKPEAEKKADAAKDSLRVERIKEVFGLGKSKLEFSEEEVRE